MIRLQIIEVLQASCLFATLVFGCRWYKKIDSATRLIMLAIAFLLILTILLIPSAQRGRMFKLANLSSILYATFVIKYFSQILDRYYAKTCFVIMVVTLIFGGYVLLMNPLSTVVNTDFQLYSSILVIVMTCFFYSRLILKFDELRLHNYAHFWLATCLLFLHGSTLFYLLFYSVAAVTIVDSQTPAETLLAVLRLTSYCGFCIVLIFTPKFYRRHVG